MKHKWMFVIALTVLVALPALASTRSEGSLSLVPTNATTVGMVRLSELRASTLTGKLFHDTDHMTADGDAERFMREAGLKPSEDVDTITMAVAPNDDDPADGEVIVIFEGRFEVDRLSAAIAGRGGKLRTANGKTYYLLPEHEKAGHDKVGAVAFLNSSTTLAGTEAAVVKALAAASNGGTHFSEASGLGRELHRIENGSSAWFLVDVQRSARLKQAPQLPKSGTDQIDALGGAFRQVAAVAVWAKEVGDMLRFGGTALVGDEETRQLIEDALRGMTAMWRMAAQEKNPELVSIIRGFKIEQTREGVSLVGSIPADMIKKQTKILQK